MNKTSERDGLRFALADVDSAREVLRDARATFHAAARTLSEQLHPYLQTLTGPLTDDDLGLLVRTDADPQAGAVLAQWFAGIHPAFGAYHVHLTLAEDFSDLPELANAFETVTAALARVNAPQCMDGYIFTIAVNGEDRREFFLSRHHNGKFTLSLIDDATGDALTPARSDVLTALMLAVEYFSAGGH